jgi:hypothetical protein
LPCVRARQQYEYPFPQALARMARQEQDRKDLLGEATALVERVSLRIAGQEDDVVAGFRRDHSASFYFGASRVYQFTSKGQLRRALVDELLFKAEEWQLIALRRERTAETVSLVRRVLDRPATEAFFEAMRSHLERLHVALANRQFTVVGQVPEHADVVGRVCRWLDQFGGCAAIARAPWAR